jgi:hypothetical protein
VAANQNRPQANMEQRIQNLAIMQSRENHNYLMADLVEHVWTPKQRRVCNGEDEGKDEGDDEGETLNSGCGESMVIKYRL